MSVLKSQHIARYAETHSQFYRRVEAVAETGIKMRRLDLTKPDVRQAVLQAINALSLYKSGVAGDYKHLTF